MDIAGIPERAALAQVAGIATAIHHLDAIDFGSVFASPSARLTQFLSPFDRAFVWMNDDDGAITQTLTDLGIDEVQCFPGIPPDNWHASAAQYYADCIGTKIEVPFHLLVEAHATAHDLIIQPGSGSAKKNWGMERFQELARELEKQGRHVSWCYGPTEAAFSHGTNTLPQLPLTELAAILANTKLFIGNDSGINHLASVVGCPTIAIFGPTNSAVWQPIGPHTHIIQGNPWPTVATVLQEVGREKFEG
ncbi:MAG: glycosyltransferase family 9 protein [Candidatus Hydrogenedentes bacterium]|nr:glycosyltransferase family 9 protein [Candidatus Hydrogenedentota bacterium]